MIPRGISHGILQECVMVKKELHNYDVKENLKKISTFYLDAYLYLSFSFVNIIVLRFKKKGSLSI